jgi:hypothetical protein
MKLTKEKLRELDKARLDYNKRMRQSHMHNNQYRTLDEYIEYVYGRKKLACKAKSFKVVNEPYRRETAKVSSLNDNSCVTNKVMPTKYTGTLIKGISTMHKSNAVPVISADDAKEHASMRR